MFELDFWTKLYIGKPIKVITTPPSDIIVFVKPDNNNWLTTTNKPPAIAIKESGISCVIASTFARIFYRNSINIGLPILECDEAAKGIEEGDKVEIDFNTGVIKNITKNETYQAEPFPEFMQNIIQNGGLIKSIEKNK